MVTSINSEMNLQKSTVLMAFLAMYNYTVSLSIGDIPQEKVIRSGRNIYDANTICNTSTVQYIIYLISVIYILYIFFYIYIYIYIYTYQNDKKIKPSYQVLRVSYKVVLQSSAWLCTG